MIISLARSVVITICMLFCSVASALEPGESIVLDPVTGNYKLTYSDELDDGTKILSHATFVPATKIAPSITSRFRLENGGAVTYNYSVTSGAQSQQVIDTVRFTLAGKITGSQVLPTNMQTSTPEQAFAVLEANSRTLSTPGGWRGSISIDTESGTSFISWEANDSISGIQPKSRINGFGFVSHSLPDMGGARFTGARKFANGYGGEGPSPNSDIAKQIQALDDNDFVPRNAAVPTIAVPAPFDAATLLDRIRTHFLTWQGKQLVEPAFASQLERYLVAAAEAFRRNQIKAGKEHLETIRELLEKEHKHLDGDDEGDEQNHDKEHRSATRPNIDRLAARVLDFDLKYVLKRLEEGKEKAEKK